MQQYRVNYPLLIGLLVGGLVASVAVYGIWLFQIKRNSGALVADAEAALSNGDYRAAVQNYSQYLAIQPEDDEARVKYATAYAELTEQPSVEIEDFGMALRVLEQTVSALPDEKALQQRLAELYGRVGRYQDALHHLSLMFDKYPDDAELRVLRATYLTLSGSFDEAATVSYKLIGYDPESDEFNIEEAAAPDDAKVYANLAAVLRTKQDKPDLADRVIDQLVVANPDSAQAHLHRGQYFLTIDEPEKAAGDIEKAYELSPEDIDVLLTYADIKTRDKDFDAARELLDTAKKLFPEETRVYQALAALQYQQQDYPGALAHVEEGLKVIGDKGVSLLSFKAELQLREDDLVGVRDTIARMRQSRFRQEYIDWMESQITIEEGRYYDASQQLSSLRSRVADMGNLPVQVDYQLGLCYERLGQLDQAADAYDLALQKDPTHQLSISGRQRVTARRGGEDPGTSVAQTPWQKAITEILNKPEEERDWAELDVMFKEMTDKEDLDPALAKLLEANLMLMRGDYRRAQVLLQEADRLTPDNLQIQRAAVQVLRLNPERGPEAAMVLLDRLVEKFKDQPILRLDRADLFIALNNEQTRPQLLSLMQGIDDWKREEKVQLWSGMAGKFINLGMFDEAREYLNLVAENQPNDLPTRLALFTLALDAKDDAGMLAAQRKILDIVGDKSDSTWLYTEARRRLSRMLRGEEGPEAADQIRAILDRAMSQRREWHDLHLVKAELELGTGNPDLALQHYDQAAKLGRPYLGAIVQHIRLLVERGDFARANQIMERLPKQQRFPLLGTLYPEILFRTNQVETAIEEARALAEADSESAAKHFLYGQLIARSSQAPNLSDDRRKATMLQAIEALERAVEIEPEMADAWYSLIACHGFLRNVEAANDVLRRAQLSLSGDLHVFLARSYEVLGRWFDAETMYRAIYEIEPSNVGRAQQLAAFYLGNVYQATDRNTKATPLINQILRAGAEGEVAGNDPSLLWARRKGAEILAATHEYQQLKKAENLLASNSQGGSLSLEDRLKMAEILAPRPEPESRLKAASLLEEVARAQPLTVQAELTLGRLYYQTQQWQKAQRQMRETIARHPRVLEPRVAYIRMLLDSGEQRSYTEANTQLQRLREVAPQHEATFEMTVRVASRLGREAEARSELVRLLPQIMPAGDLNSARVRTLQLFATLLVDLKAYDDAEKIYRRLAEADPEKSYALALFLGLHREVEQSFALLREIHSLENVDKTLDVSNTILRARRGEIGDQFDSQVRQWLDRALLENPGAINLLMAEADFLDIQQRYEEAMAVYSKLLDRRELTGLRRAIVLNNLSYLAALAGSNSSDIDALRLVREAETIIGPTADILDTRAVALIARDQFSQAIEDMKLAVTDNPTASKYFHKAVAHLGARENLEALESWARAEELGLNRDEINRLEHERFDQTKARIDELRGRAASLTRDTSPQLVGN